MLVPGCASSNQDRRGAHELRISLTGKVRRAGLTVCMQCACTDAVCMLLRRYIDARLTAASSSVSLLGRRVQESEILRPRRRGSHTRPVHPSASAPSQRGCGEAQVAGGPAIGRGARGQRKSPQGFRDDEEVRCDAASETSSR